MRWGEKHQAAYLLLAAASITGAASVPDASVPTRDEKKLLESCEAHKFEAIIQVTVDGRPHRSRMRLCGVKGQSDADWIKTLKNAVAKTAGNQDMQPAVKKQVIAALKAEISRLRAVASAEPPLAVSGPSIDLSKVGEPSKPATPPAPKEKLARTYSSLPSLPTAPTVETPHYVSPSMPLLARPRMDFSCHSPSDIGGPGPCVEFERETLMTVRAGEDVPAGTSIRFVRNGERRADIQLAELKRGKSLRFTLPRELCMGVVGATLEVQVVRTAPGIDASGQVVGREGPYNLRC